jgi:hypothetical protein
MEEPVCSPDIIHGWDNFSLKSSRSASSSTDATVTLAHKSAKFLCQISLPIDREEALDTETGRS